MTTTQRIDLGDVSEWIEVNLANAKEQWDRLPENQCARDVFDRWSTCRRYFMHGVQQFEQVAKAPPRFKP